MTSTLARLGDGLSSIRNRTPVPLAPNSIFSLPLFPRFNVERALRTTGSVGTLFAIVNRLSESVAGVDVCLYNEAPADGEEEDRGERKDHMAYDMLMAPNSFMSWQTFIETSQQHLDLVGETWWVVYRVANIPIEMWPIRPDKMNPIPHPTKFVSGYEYTGPDGQKIPLDTKDVIFIRMPNPLDLYRGMGPVQSILADLDSSRFSAEWNRNFFLNSAEPGGIIEFPDRLDDGEFKEITSRWREQHQGVAQAHRVAVLEKGKYVDRKYSMRDMQFAELRRVTAEVIREAFGFPKPLLGTTDDVNRANAEAAEVMFARWLIKPRMDRIIGALNQRFLPMFAGTEGLEFDYENPIPADAEAEDRGRESKAKSWAIYVAAGADRKSAAEALEVPEMEYGDPPAAGTGVNVNEEGEVSVQPTTGEGPVPPSPGEEGPEDRRDGGARGPGRRVQRRNRSTRVRAAATDVDLADVQDQYEEELAAVLGAWVAIQDTQIEEIVAQIVQAVNSGNARDLGNVRVSTFEAEGELTNALQRMHSKATHQVVKEAERQGVYGVNPIQADMGLLSGVAAITATFLATILAVSAGQEAMRVWTTGRSANEVGEATRTHLQSLTQAYPKLRLGAALGTAQNDARIRTFQAAPEARWYATEVLDKNICGPCRSIDGQEYTDLVDARLDYPSSGYINCEGGVRCRGTLVAIWQPVEREVA